jgi:hypothetical protein
MLIILCIYIFLVWLLPASTGSKPSLPTSSITPGFRTASSPATSMTGLTQAKRFQRSISPQITSSPCLIQARPNVAPTDPAPMIAIRMNTSWFCENQGKRFQRSIRNETPKMAPGDKSRKHTPVAQILYAETEPYRRNAAVPRRSERYPRLGIPRTSEARSCS